MRIWVSRGGNALRSIETARVHHAAWRGGRVAARGARAAAGDAGGWIDQRRGPEPAAYRLTGFRQGLSEAGHVEGQNVAIEYRAAGGGYALIPERARVYLP